MILIWQNGHHLEIHHFKKLYSCKIITDYNVRPFIIKYNNITAHVQKPAHWKMDPSICKAANAETVQEIISPRLKKLKFIEDETIFETVVR